MTRARIAVSLLTKEQDFQALQAADATTIANRLGVDLEVVFAKNNSRLQIEQLYHFIHAQRENRPLAIAVQTVAGDGLPQVARDAVKAGIGWLLLNREAAYIEQLRTEYAALPIAIVSIDQTAIGRIQGRQFRKLLPHGGTALYVQGPSDTSAARDRLNGLQEILVESAIDLKILNGEWTEASGERAVKRWIDLSSSHDCDLNLVAAQNDAMALGARKAISVARPEWLKLPFVGCDGLPEGGQRLVREGVFAATVIVPPSAGAAVNLATAHARSGAPVAGRVILSPKPYPPAT